MEVTDRLSAPPVVDVDTLVDALASADPPTLLDLRWTLGGEPGHRAYLRGHLPGAVFLDLDHDLCGPHRPGTGRHPLPDPDRLRQALRRAGVRTGHPVVVYEHGAPPVGAAARAWWTLRWAGHPEVSVLDGGYAAWLAAGHPVTTDEPGPTPGDVEVRPGAVPVPDATAAAALAAGGALVDVRTPERYRGEHEPIDPVAGHVPGARNVPASGFFGPDGRLRPAGEIRSLVAAAGLDTARPLGVYCGSGVTAAHTALALTAAGLDPVLYVGSWSDWIADPDRPVATGDAP